MLASPLPAIIHECLRINEFAENHKISRMLMLQSSDSAAGRHKHYRTQRENGRTGNWLQNDASSITSFDLALDLHHTRQQSIKLAKE